MDAVIDEYRASKSYQQDVVDLLRPELERTLSQAHDYKQFVQQIVQNMNVVVETKYIGATFDEKLDQATHEETAVYWAAVLMDEKLDAALYLDEPERIAEPREQARFRLHGLVLKYVHIYKSRADRKSLTVRVNGESWAKVEGNARAIGIIPHTLIDNAIKYSPRRTRIEVDFEEVGGWVVLSIENSGPKLEEDEKPRIFDLFFRGAAARAMSTEGTGFGLASAQNIARAHNTEITMSQSGRRGPDDTVRTKFTVRFPIAADGRSERVNGRQK
jgi:signal transduction histidine kinase